MIHYLDSINAEGKSLSFQSYLDIIGMVASKIG